MIREFYNRNAIYIESFLLLIVMTIIVSISPTQPIADEKVYFSNLNWKGSFWASAFISQYQGTAGIVSTWMFSLFPDFVIQKIVYLRLVFVVQFVLSVFLVIKYLLPIKFRGNVLMIIAVPGTIVLCARAMGDFPPVLFLIIYLVGFNNLSKINNAKLTRIGIILFISIIGSLAVIGKQSLMFIFLLWPLGLYFDKRIRLYELILAYTALLPIPIYLFSIWHGIAPSSTKIIKSSVYTWEYAEFIWNWFFIAFVILGGRIEPQWQFFKSRVILFISIVIVFYLAQSNFKSDLNARSLHDYLHLVYHLELAVGSVIGVSILIYQLFMSFSFEKLIISICIIALALASIRLTSMQMRYPAAYFPLVLLFIGEDRTRISFSKYVSLIGFAFNLVNFYLLYHIS